MLVRTMSLKGGGVCSTSRLVPRESRTAWMSALVGTGSMREVCAGGGGKSSRK